ncbi:helix-turn-helix domain containing protein [Streptomyces sp. HNM0663]|uniref:Helix-turn-helix domain containing protein n=1 Tax=Streptomyces chengmaiensis TaxID=3040919 RepID=A0ABT6HXZ2_9ACTN|nr:helix-turn-helix domain containing protein [Streptomyces chengmaiensis]MDH2393555.1 helix-turn-helix domain containing protein [Streptomyces chengmaiensis]
MASTTRRPSTAADRRAAVEERILSAIGELLHDGRTYTELGVEQIAAAGGISRSGFYLYFRDKVDVLLRLSGFLKSDSFGIVQGWQPCGPAGGLDGLARTYEQLLRHYRKHAALLAAINEVAAYDPSVRESWTSTQDRFIDHSTKLLIEEQSAGRTPADVDPLCAARVMVRGGGQVIAQQVATSDGHDDPVVARELAYGYWYGIFRRPERS